jgi:hypothetical protein
MAVKEVGGTVPKTNVFGTVVRIGHRCLPEITPQSRNSLKGQRATLPHNAGLSPVSPAGGNGPISETATRSGGLGGWKLVPEPISSHLFWSFISERVSGFLLRPCSTTWHTATSPSGKGPFSGLVTAS